MLIDRTLDEITKKNKVVIGFDLGNDYSQISFCRQNQSMPDTFSMVMGEEQYNIPTLLCRQTGMEGTVTWSMGKEAIKNAKEGQGILVENLVMLVQSQSTIKIAGEEVLAEALLEIFIKKAIAVLGAYIKI